MPHFCGGVALSQNIGMLYFSVLHWSTATAPGFVPLGAHLSSEEEREGDWDYNGRTVVRVLLSRTLSGLRTI